MALYPWTTDFANGIPTPAVHGNEVIVTSAYNHYAMCKVKITLKGAKKIWEHRNPSGVCSPVVHDDTASAPREVEQRYNEIVRGREVARNIAAMESAGSRVIYRAVDVRDAAAVTAIIDEARRDCGPIRGRAA